MTDNAMQVGAKPQPLEVVVNTPSDKRRLRRLLKGDSFEDRALAIEHQAELHKAGRLVRFSEIDLDGMRVYVVQDQGAHPRIKPAAPTVEAAVAD